MIVGTAAVLLLAGFMPSTARGQVPGLPGVPGVPGVGDAVDAVTPDSLTPAGLAGDLVGALFEQLFELFLGELPRDLGEGMLRYLLTYPTVQDEFAPLGASLAELEPLAYTLAGGFFLLTLARIVGSKPSGVWEAPKRLLLALVGITGWPWAFGQLLVFEQVVAGGVLETAARREAGELLLGALVGPGQGFGMLIGLLAGLALIGLLVIKVLAIAALAALWLLVPFALAAWVYPGTAHYLGICAQALVAILAGPVAWTVILVVFASLGDGALRPSGDFGDTFMRPLVSLALLVMLVGALPAMWSAARARGLMAGVAHGQPSPGASSTIGRAVSRTVGYRLLDAAWSKASSSRRPAARGTGGGNAGGQAAAAGGADKPFSAAGASGDNASPGQRAAAASGSAAGAVGTAGGRGDGGRRWDWWTGRSASATDEVGGGGARMGDAPVPPPAADAAAGTVARPTRGAPAPPAAAGSTAAADADRQQPGARRGPAAGHPAAADAGAGGRRAGAVGSEPTGGGTLPSDVAARTGLPLPPVDPDRDARRGGEDR